MDTDGPMIRILKMKKGDMKIHQLVRTFMNLTPSVLSVSGAHTKSFVSICQEDIVE